MKIKQLIDELNKLINDNPQNADLEVKWYDGFRGYISHGDGWPIQLFKNIYTKQIYCVLNAVDNPPAFGLVVISNKHEKYNDNRTVNC